MTDEAKEYRLQGCFNSTDNEDIGLLLGTGYTRPQTSKLSLSSCLRACASAQTSANASYPYVGVTGGDSCYCSYQFNSTIAIADDWNQCATPCQGNATEACGGTNAMSVYKLATANYISMSDTTGDTSAIGEESSNGANQSTYTGTNMMSPSAAAGVAVGTIVALGVLLAFILFWVKSRKRRIQQHANQAENTQQQPEFQLQIHSHQSRPFHEEPGSIFSSMTDLPNEMGRITSTASTPFNTESTRGEEKATIRDATIVDLKRLSGIVVDGRSTPRKGVYAQQDDRAGAGRKSISYIDGNIRQIDVIAASSTTGAQWRHTQNLPLTPRTPRYRSDWESEDHDGEQQEDDRPLTPVAPVQEPESVAQVNGLGDRAWHRKRLSLPFLPRGGEFEFADDTCGSSRHNKSGRSSPNWRPATGAESSRVGSSVANEPIAEGSWSDGPPTPRPLKVDVVSKIYDADEEDGPALSPRWFWTVSSLGELSDGGSGKASKID